uniref:Uncharacterized protein n=1 Tax=Tetranychus urticae TaxID=32264 RepID=T1KRA0_TETUR
MKPFNMIKNNDNLSRKTLFIDLVLVNLFWLTLIRSYPLVTIWIAR